MQTLLLLRCKDREERLANARKQVDALIDIRAKITHPDMKVTVNGAEYTGAFVMEQANRLIDCHMETIQRLTA